MMRSVCDNERKNKRKNIGLEIPRTWVRILSRALDIFSLNLSFIKITTQLLNIMSEWLVEIVMYFKIINYMHV